MQYYKLVNDEIVASIGTINADGNGNLTEEEYNSLRAMFTEKPTGKRIHDNGDGTYSYEDAPPMPEPDVEPEEALEILLGGAV